MKKEVYPGARCKIIGSSVGPKGTSVGRFCYAIGKAKSLTGEPHTLWGFIWECESADGKPFDIIQGDGTIKRSLRAAFAEDWLLVVEDDPEPPKVQEKEQILTE